MADKSQRCAICQVRNHALGGRARTGQFMLAIPICRGGGQTAWPRIGSLAWCGDPDGEVERLTIIRIALTRAAMRGASALLCQHCLAVHQSRQGILSDLFQSMDGAA